MIRLRIVGRPVIEMADSIVVVKVVGQQGAGVRDVGIRHTGRIHGDLLSYTDYQSRATFQLFFRGPRMFPTNVLNTLRGLFSQFD